MFIRIKQATTSLRVKVALVLMLAFFVVTAANYFASLAFTRMSISDVMEKELSLALDIADTVVTTKISLLKSNAETVAARLNGYWPGDIEEAMEQQLLEFSEFLSLTVYDRSGVVAEYGMNAKHDIIQSDKELMQLAFDGALVLSSPHHNFRGDLVMHVFVPMGKGMVLSADVPGMLFSEILAQYRLWDTGNIFIVDAEGTFIANYRSYLVYERHNFIEEAKTDADLRTAGAFFQQAVSSSRGSGRYFFNGEERLSVYKVVTDSVMGWRIGVAAPLNENPQRSIQHGLLFAAASFMALGILLSALISGVAVKPFERIEAQNRHLEELNDTVGAQAALIQEEHERIKLLLDATPLACRLWNRNYEVFECNDESVKLFGLTDKQEYMDKVFDLSPEFQPDGQRSREKIVKILERAFVEGRDVFEWVHQALDGTLIPCEITLVRVRYGDDFVIAGYTRDQREYKKMMADIEQRDNLLTTGNSTAAILLSKESEDHVEAALYNAMALVGHTTDVDRVQIWRNEKIDGLLHFVHTYEWLSETGLKKPTVPIGLKFPYRDKPEWEQMFMRGECINGPVASLPKEDRNFLGAYEMKAIVIIPLFIQDTFWGFFSLDDCKKERTFNEDEILILRSVSLMMANTLNRGAQAAKIREANEYTELLLEAMPFSCNLWDSNSRLFKCNEGSVRMFEVGSKQEFIDCFNELSPEFQPDGSRSAEQSRANVKKALEEGRYDTEWMHQKRDGTPIPCEVTLVRVAYGAEYVVAAYVRDLREQKSMMAEIERSIELLSAVNQAAGVLLRSEMDDFSTDFHACMVMVADAVGVDRISIWKNYVENGRLYYFSQAFAWAGKAQKMDNEAAQYTIMEPRCYDEVVPGWESLLSGGGYISSLIRDLPPQEQPHFARQGIQSIFVTPVFIENQFWGFVGYDSFYQEKIFTENEQMTMHSAGIIIANALLRNDMMRNLQSANNAKSDFLTKMSHEMRTPLNAIIGLSELALEDTALHEDTRLSIEQVSNAGATLLSTVNDILDISRIESGMLELVPVTYDTPSLLNDTVTQSIMYIGEKPIRFVLDINETLPTKLIGDDLRVKQICNNLLSNAFKYTKEGTVELGVRCAREGSETVLMTIWIRDTGVGIKQEDLGALFEDFVQVDKMVNRHVMGTGLGLSITKKMAEMMGGNVTVESEYGKGSTFTVTLKQKYVTDEQIGPEVVENLKSFRYSDHKRRGNANMARIRLPNARVLVVDDNITNLDVARGLMKPYGMQVDCVTGGQQAIDAVREESVHYNAVFMDHMMPGMDGIEATRLIRLIDTEYARRLPIIACTANAIAGNEEMFLSKGFQAFISKPIEIGRLDDIIRRWVRGKDMDLEAREADSDIGGYAGGGTEGGIGGSTGGGTEEGMPKQTSIGGFTIEGVDLGKAVARFGSEDTYLKVVRSFIVNTRLVLQRISAVDRDNLTEYAIEVHGMKSAMRGVGAESLGDMAESLEHAAKSGDYPTVESDNQALVDATEKLIGTLEDLLDKAEEGHVKASKDMPDKASLMKLMTACDAYDMDGVDEVMAEIGAYEYTADDGLAAWLWENVLQLNFSQIVERLSLLSERAE